MILPHGKLVGLLEHTQSTSDSSNIISNDDKVRYSEIVLSLLESDALTLYPPHRDTSRILHEIKDQLQSVLTSIAGWNRKWRDATRVVGAKLGLLQSAMDGYQLKMTPIELYYQIALCGQWHPVTLAALPSHWNEQGLSRLQSSAMGCLETMLEELRMIHMSTITNASLNVRELISLHYGLEKHLSAIEQNTLFHLQQLQKSCNVVLHKLDETLRECSLCRDSFALYLIFIREVSIESTKRSELDTDGSVGEWTMSVSERKLLPWLFDPRRYRALKGPQGIPAEIVTGTHLYAYLGDADLPSGMINEYYTRNNRTAGNDDVLPLPTPPPPGLLSQKKSYYQRLSTGTPIEDMRMKITSIVSEMEATQFTTTTSTSSSDDIKKESIRIQQNSNETGQNRSLPGCLKDAISIVDDIRTCIYTACSLDTQRKNENGQNSLDGIECSSNNSNNNNKYSRYCIVVPHYNEDISSNDATFLDPEVRLLHDENGTGAILISIQYNWNTLLLLKIIIEKNFIQLSYSDVIVEVALIPIISDISYDIMNESTSRILAYKWYAKDVNNFENISLAIFCSGFKKKSCMHTEDNERNNETESNNVEIVYWIARLDINDVTFHNISHIVAKRTDQGTTDSHGSYMHISILCDTLLQMHHNLRSEMDKGSAGIHGGADEMDGFPYVTMRRREVSELHQTTGQVSLYTNAERGLVCVTCTAPSEMYVFDFEDEEVESEDEHGDGTEDDDEVHDENSQDIVMTI
jgi:hypothetical protein